MALTTGNGDESTTYTFRIKLELNGQDCEGADMKKPAYLEGEIRAIWDIMEDVPEGQFAKNLAKSLNVNYYSKTFNTLKYKKENL